MMSFKRIKYFYRSIKIKKSYKIYSLFSEITRFYVELSYCIIKYHLSHIMSSVYIYKSQWISSRTL